MGVPARATGYSGIPGACSQSIYRMLLNHRCQLAALMLAHAFGKLAVGPDTPAVRVQLLLALLARKISETQAG